MLDQIIRFSDDVNARTVTVTLDKEKEYVHVKADGAPGVTYNIKALRSSHGGMLNDLNAIDVLNRQLGNTPKRPAR